MAQKMKNVPFKGTAEQEAQLRSMIAELKGEKGFLMPIMQKAQDIYGYLPEDQHLPWDSLLCQGIRQGS